MTKQTEALKMAYDWLNEYAPPEVVQACKEALERPTNMVAVPADHLEKMQQELKQLRDEHKKWQRFARRVS